MQQSDDSHDHDGGLARDLPLLTRRRLVTGFGLATLGIVGAAYGLGGRPGQAETTVTGTAADGSVCVADPVETSGPFPADGTNAKAGQKVNALTESGVVRQDIRPSFGGLTGVADGVPLQIEITLVDVGQSCAVLADHAIYIWHADAGGHYSLYDLGDQNYLRGVSVTDAAGRVRFTTVVPGCYDGRWPHIHFEVFKTRDTAVSGEQSLLISQFALPQDACAAVYAKDARYSASTANLARTSLASDMVFGDNTAEQVAAQTPVFSGDAASGFSAKVAVGITSA